LYAALKLDPGYSFAPEDLAYLQDLLFRRTGIILHTDKAYLVETRLAPLLNKHKITSLTVLISRIRADERGILCDEALDAFTTNETSFFRDMHPFNFLAEEVLPPLIEARRDKRRLRLWSAASSTGQEAVSLAILISERFPGVRDWDVQILGTDISAEALEKARSGLYRQLDVRRGLSDHQINRFFEPSIGRYLVRPELRAMTRFEPLNLVRDPIPPERFDVVFLRNVLIYFDGPTRLSVLRKLHPQIARDGVLVLGGAEAAQEMPPGLYSHGRSGRTVWHRPL
jgi:chemotaxis protein methyltransferase CheR